MASGSSVLVRRNNEGMLQNLPSTNGLALSWAEAIGLKVNDSAIVDYVAPDDVAGKDIYFEGQGGGVIAAGTTGLKSGDITWTMGTPSNAKAASAANGGPGGTFSIIGAPGGTGDGAGDGGVGSDIVAQPGLGGTAGATGAAGADGKFIIRQPGGTLGADEIQIAHGGSSATFYVMDSVSLYVQCSGLAPNNSNTTHLGGGSNEWYAGYFGENTVTGSKSASGLYLGLAQEARLRWNKDATNFPPASLILGHAAVGSAAVDALAISSATITGFAALATVAGRDTYIATQSGLDSNVNGGSIIWEMGAAHGSGTGANFTVVPGATTSGTVGKFTVQQPGGNPGTDEWGMWDDGTISHLRSQQQTAYISHSYVADLITLNSTGVTIKDDWALVLGSSLDWRVKNVTTNPVNHLELLEAVVPALAFLGTTIVGGGFDAAADTDGNDIYIATQTGGAHTSNNPRGGNLIFEMGAGGSGGTGLPGYLGVRQDGLATTPTDGLVLENSTAALVGETVEMGPRIRQRGYAWDTDNSVSRSVDWIQEALPATGNTVTSIYKWGVSLDGGAYAYRMTLSSAGQLSSTSAAFSSSVLTPTLATIANDTTLTLQSRSFINTDSAIEAVTGTMTQGTGETLVGFMIKPTYNQTDTAAGTDLLVSRTETAVGSGNQYLLDLGTTTDGTYANHTSKFSVDNAGRASSTIFNQKAGSDLTIAGGSVTATNGFHRIVVQGAIGAGADDLDTIVAGSDGDILVIAPKTSGANDTVTAKDGTGNLVLAGDFIMDHVQDRLTLIYSTSDSGWVELCRSSNA